MDSFDKMAEKRRFAGRLLVPAAAAEAEFVEVKSWNLKRNIEFYSKFQIARENKNLLETGICC